MYKCKVKKIDIIIINIIFSYYHFMGVKGLNKFLLSNGHYSCYDNMKSYITYLEKIKRSRKDKKPVCIGIDFWSYVYKHASSIKNIAYNYFLLLTDIYSFGAIPFVIFDGKAPDAKSDVLKERYTKKEKVIKKIKDLETNIEISNEDNKDLIKKKDKLERSLVDISNEEVENIKRLFDLMNVYHEKANGEADYLAAHLYEKGVIDCCMTEDMDLVGHGCKKIFYMDKASSKIIEFDLDLILDKLYLTKHEFIDMCLLCGCDYIKPSYRLKPYEIYDIIRSIKIINNSNIVGNEVVEYLCAGEYISEDKKDNFISSMDIGRDLFLNAHKKEKSNVKPKMKNIDDINKIISYMSILISDFSTFIVNCKLTKVNNAISKYLHDKKEDIYINISNSDKSSNMFYVFGELDSDSE